METANKQFIIQAKSSRDGSKPKFVQRYQSNSVPKRIVRTKFDANARGFETRCDAQMFINDINKIGGFFLLDFTIIKREVK
jgi:hypothetical protein